MDLFLTHSICSCQDRWDSMSLTWCCIYQLNLTYPHAQGTRGAVEGNYTGNEVLTLEVTHITFPYNSLARTNTPPPILHPNYSEARKCSSTMCPEWREGVENAW